MSTDSGTFDSLTAYIERNLDFATSYYNDAYLDRRVTARIRRTEATDYVDYLELLERDDGEREQLLDSLSVNVTGFFRNPAVWERLRPVLRSVTERRRPRLWSAPCSDGRETYSLAMLALDDETIDTRQLTIHGTDIDREALAVARRGVYESTRITDIGEELAPLNDHGRYVDVDDTTFSVTDRVKQLVSFDYHDLIQGDSRGQYDLVLCRNLLIYIDPAYKRSVFETIRDSLTDGGYVVIGKSETLPRSVQSEFEPVERTERIYRRV